MEKGIMGGIAAFALPRPVRRPRISWIADTLVKRYMMG